MLESYAFLTQVPDDVLLKKQKEVIKTFYQGKSFIYFISDGYHTKIGKADNVFSRLNALQVGNPRKLILVGIKSCFKNEVIEREKDLHELFADKKIRGEWFFLTDSDLHGYFGAEVMFTDYFVDPVFFEKWGFYKDCSDIQRNINDRITNNYCKTPYYENINRKR